MADDPRVRPAADAMEAAALLYLDHGVGTFYRDDIAAATLAAADVHDPLRVLLADEERALEFATRARYEAARQRITAVLPSWEDASEYLKKAWRDETPKVVGPVLAALRKEADRG